MPATLPNELIDRIVDYLHDDPQMLSACALVRSSWVPAVRFHRFGRVRLQPHTMISFRALLQASPEVSPFVRYLLLFGLWSPVQNMAVLRDMFSSLTALRVLSLHYSSLASHEAHELFSTLPKSLESVKIDNIVLPTFGDLIFLWSQLPRLRTLVLAGRAEIRGAEIPEEYMHHSGNVLQATEIQLLWHAPFFDVIADWMCSQKVPAQLRACSMTVARSECIVSAAKLLRAVGPALQSLELHLNNGEGTLVQDLDMLYACNLAQCTNLQELHLSSRIWDSCSYGTMMIQIISRVRAPRIRTLVLFLWGFYPSNVDRAVAQLGKVAAAVLNNDAFRELDRIEVRLVEPLSTPISEDIYASIRDRFKPFTERGLLTIEGNKRYEVQWVH